MLKLTFKANVVFFVLTASLLCCNALAQQSNKHASDPYVKFLKNDHLKAVDYVLQLFNHYEMVVLCERIHTEATQWDLIFDIVSDERFINNVGNMFTEYGVVNLQPFLDDFMRTDSLSQAEIEERVVHIMRNLNFWAVWSNTNFYNFLIKLYALNRSLIETKRIHLYFSDIPFSWDDMTQAKYDSIRQNLFPKRDRIMADRIEAEFKEILKSTANTKKCLVVMNYRHAFGPIRDSNGNLLGNTCEYLFEAFQSKVANVLINTISYDSAGNFVRIQNGTWDAAFNKVGNPEIGFDFTDSPFGEDSFDLFPFRPWIKVKYKYQDVFTGFIFYKPLNEHIIQYGFPRLYDDFEEIALSRARCIGDEYYERMKKIIAERKENPIEKFTPSYGKD